MPVSFTTASPLESRRTPIAGTFSGLGFFPLALAKLGANPPTWDAVHVDDVTSPYWQDHSSVEVSGSDVTFSFLPIGGWQVETIDFRVVDAFQPAVTVSPEAGTALARFEPIELTVSTLTLDGCHVVVKLGPTPYRWLWIYDGPSNEFAPFFSLSERLSNTELRLLPRGGWPTDDVNIEVYEEA